MLEEERKKKRNVSSVSATSSAFAFGTHATLTTAASVTQAITSAVLNTTTTV